MRRAALLAMIAWGCEESGPVVRIGDGGASDAVMDAHADLIDPNATCDCADGGPVYVRCISSVCTECVSSRNCGDNALGPWCAGTGAGAHCICTSNDDCATNVHGPVCSGTPAFCGCTGPADCPSGACVTDSYVAGEVCAP